MRPWTQLSASPLFQWKSVVDHIDHAAPRAPRRWTTARPRKGTTRSRGRRDSGCARVEEHEARPVLVWAAGARRPEVEEALRPLDGHSTITGARIVHID